MAGNLQRRLKRLEQQLAQIAKSSPQAMCNCRQFTVSFRPEDFAAEMNQTCPAHAFRSLGKIDIIPIRLVGKNGVQEISTGLTELLEEYKRRRARHHLEMFERREEEEDDSAEL